MKGKRIPETIFNVRVRDDSVGGDNPYKWENISSNDIFSGKTVLMFSLPGAFTPTCSTYQLPDFEKLFEMDRESFGALPKWKRTVLKKRLGLF